MSLKKQVAFMKKKGLLLTIRKRNGKTTYIYVHRNLFAEVAYEDDNPEATPLSAKLIYGLENLNKYLQNDRPGKE